MNLKLPSDKVITIVVAVIVLVVVITFSKRIVRFITHDIFGDRDPVDYDDTPIPGGPVSTGFDPRPYSARLREVLLDWIWVGTERCEEYYKLMQLSDAEFVMVCNDYKNSFGVTLRTDMNNTWYSTCVLFNTQYGDLVIERMDELGVIG